MQSGDLRRHVFYAFLFEFPNRRSRFNLWSSTADSFEHRLNKRNFRSVHDNSFPQDCFAINTHNIDHNSKNKWAEHSPLYLRQ